MTFEEWWDWYWHDKVDKRLWDATKQVDWAIIREHGYKEVWEAAREGMIPADRAIEIPEVEKWPGRAAGVALCYYNKAIAVSGFQREEQPFEFIKIIPRPIPAWKPKVGDPVFAYNGGVPWVAKVIDASIVDGVVQELLCPDGGRSALILANLKPFDASKIGMKWEDI